MEVLAPLRSSKFLEIKVKVALAVSPSPIFGRRRTRRDTARAKPALRAWCGRYHPAIHKENFI